MKKLTLLILLLLTCSTAFAAVHSGTLTFVSDNTGGNVDVAVTGEGISLPTYVSGAIDTTGLIFTADVSEALSVGAGGNGGWSLTSDLDGALGLTYASGTDPLLFDVSAAVTTGAVVTVDYTQPVNGFEDVQGDDLASLVAQAVTNGSNYSPPASYIFSTDWQDGTGILNTGGAFAWDSVTGESTGVFEEKTDSAGFRGSSDYVSLDAAPATEAYLYKAFGAQSSLSVRYAFKVVSTSLNYNSHKIMQINAADTAPLAYVYVADDNGAGVKLKMLSWDTSDSASYTTHTPILIVGNWYQVEINYTPNASNGATLKLWDDAGTTLIDTLMFAGPTRNMQPAVVHLGDTDTGGVAGVYLFDDVVAGVSAVGPKL